MTVSVNGRKAKTLPPLQPPTCLYEALKQETKRIMTTNTVDGEHVESLLELLLESHHFLLLGPIHRWLPRLLLRLNHITSRSGTVDTRVAKALRALSAILAHSLRLKNFPKLKVEFWRYVLCSVMMHGSNSCEELDVESWIWMTADERFPCVEINMSRKGKLTDAHMDQLFTFMTTPPPATGLDERFASQCPIGAIGIGLRFGSYKLKPNCLRLVQGLLDRVYASPTRQFVVQILDLSNQEMSLAHLDHVAGIVKKNHTVYKIENIQLSKLIKAKASHEEVQATRNLMAIAFEATDQGSLRTLNLGSNPLDVQSVAAFCSALRYGCQVEVLDIGSSLNKLDKAEREECWKWLAFGIFYPRSTKLAAENKFRSINLCWNPLEPGDIAAFKRTLSDPAGELVVQGEAKRQATKADELLLCTIRQGAQFYSTAKANLQVLHELVKETELEALYHQKGWTCVVLPGLGLAWTENDQILNIEREQIDRLSFQSSNKVEWAFAGMLRNEALLGAFCVFLECVGSQLSYLDLTDAGINQDPETVPAIIKHCVNLEHLIINSNEVDDRAIEHLLSALKDGPLGAKLLSLDISDNEFSDAVIEKIAQTLSNPLRVPVLQDLRMMQNGMEHESFASLHQALSINKRLRYLELSDLDDKQEDLELATARRDAIEEDFQGEQLLVPMPLRAKLAFLSVIQHEMSSVKSVRHSLDALMASLVLKFAGDYVQRHIIWEEPMGSHGNDDF